MSLHDNALLTRDAEGLFWMARYIERVENLARLIDVTQTFESPGHEAESWAALIAINTDQDGLSTRGLQPDGPSVKRFYLLDRDNPTSIPYAMEAARTNARKLRPLISTEMWMQLNVFHRDVLHIDPGRARWRRTQPAVPPHQGRGAGAYRDHGGNVLPRPGLALLRARPTAGAGRTRRRGCSTSSITCWSAGPTRSAGRRS